MFNVRNSEPLKAINNARAFESIADIGGRQVLGMGGSLMGYIQTGNPYDKDYYVSNRSRYDAENIEKQKTRKLVNNIVTVGAIAGAAIGSFFLIKKGGVKQLNNLKNVVSKGFNGLKGNVSKLFNNAKNQKIDKAKISNNAKKGFNSIKNFLTGGIDKLKGSFNNIAKRFNKK